MMRYEVLPYENIRNLRVDAGMTQQQVAEYLNVKQNTYSQYEIGVLNYPIDVLCRLADLYQVSVDYLLGRTDEKKPYPRKQSHKKPCAVRHRAFVISAYFFFFLPTMSSTTMAITATTTMAIHRPMWLVSPVRGLA